MYRQEKTANPYLDIAEKSRAYDRHTHALITNPHYPISSHPVVAPSVVVYARRRREERNLVRKVNRMHSNSIDEIWRRAHRMEIKNDTQLLKPELHERGSMRTWSEMLKSCEADFPPVEDRKRINKNAQNFLNQSLNRPMTATFSSSSGKRDSRRKAKSSMSLTASICDRPESGMSVEYNSTGTKTSDLTSSKSEESLQATPQPQRRRERLLGSTNEYQRRQNNDPPQSPIPESPRNDENESNSSSSSSSSNNNNNQGGNERKENINENNNENPQKKMSLGNFRESLEVIANQDTENDDTDGALLDQISKSPKQN